MSAVSWGHLARRFLGTLRPGGPGPSDERWVADKLLPGELGLWAGMSGADRRHAVDVARHVDAALGDAASRPVIAAALLHDVGKVESALGPIGRAVATVAGMAWGHDAARGWRGRRGLVGRAGRYLCHDAIGADLLARAGSDPLTVTWAREHHLPPSRWSVPQPVGHALKAADDD